MNALQIQAILGRNRHTAPYFRGVFPADGIKTYGKYPYCFVANTMQQGTPGEHWVAFYVKSANSVEYFDSFGEWPPGVAEFAAFLSNFKSVRANKHRIQAPYEISCGPHVIYFLLQRCRGQSFDAIVREVSHPLSDALVKLYVYQLVIS